MNKILLTLGIACFGLVGNSYAQLPLENFDAGVLPPNWVLINDGHTVNTTFIDAQVATSLDASAWAPLEYTTGDYVMVTTSDFTPAGTADRWLITPSFTVNDPNMVIQWDDNDLASLENLQVMVSPTAGATAASFTDVLYNGPAAPYDANGDLVTHKIHIGSYNGQTIRIAFHDNTADNWGMVIDNVTTIVAPNTDLQLTSLSPVAGAANAYGAVNGSLAMSGTVTNNGLSAVSSYTINYMLNSGAVVSNTISGTIPSFGTGNFSVSVALPSTLGTYPIKAWVSLSGDDVHTNDSAATAVTTVPFMPEKKVLIEEGTGSWCGYCVRGIVYMDSLWSMYASTTNIVSVHDYGNYDPMAIENSDTRSYDTLISDMISGYPSIVIDRSVSDDPLGAFTDYNNMINNFGFADLALTGSLTGGKVNVSVNVRPALNMTGDYRLEMVVTEDSVHGTNPGYLQHNYYSNANQGGSAGPLSGQGVNYQTEPFAIPNEYFKFVDRYTIPSDLNTNPNGVAGSLPASMTAGTIYSYNFAPVTIASDWVSSNLRVVVMLIDNNPNNTTYGQVLNSTNSIWTPLAITNVNAGIDQVRLFPNPASQEAYLSFSLQQTSNVQVEVYDAIGRLIYNTPAQSMNAGAQQLTIPTDNFASGVYNVKIQTENGIVTQRLSVVR